MAERFARDESKEAIAQEFKPLVVYAAAALPVRAMGESAVEALRMREMMTEDGLQFLALLFGHGSMASITALAALPPVSLRRLPWICSDPAWRRETAHTCGKNLPHRYSVSIGTGRHP